MISKVKEYRKEVKEKEISAKIQERSKRKEK
jgi:hypothetical protein